LFRLLLVFLLAPLPLPAQLTPVQKNANLESFETIWRTVRDRFPDPKLNGIDWQAVHDSTRPLVANAASMEEFHDIVRGMLAKLNASHYAVFPEDMYKGPSDAAATAFGNLPAQNVAFESRRLPSGAGYIRFSEFLDPAVTVPKFQAAIESFVSAPGVVLDLRGNPGGIGIMAMGIAGFFIDRGGLELGTMKTRDTTLRFVIFPRPETYSGPLAVLVDERSASTAEIFAQGLQDLKRARIFGTRTAGAALPSDIIRLPNGDGFQYAEASYTSKSGRVLEGNGVVPDVEVRQTAEAEAEGRDLVIEAAEAWIRALPR
jgi:C-terminal processing protease CtpA/Prc